MNTQYLELYHVSVLKLIERGLNRDVIRTHAVTKLLPDGDKWTIKLEERFAPLTDDELMETYVK